MTNDLTSSCYRSAIILKTDFIFFREVRTASGRAWGNIGYCVILKQSVFVTQYNIIFQNHPLFHENTVTLFSINDFAIRCVNDSKFRCMEFSNIHL
ncbi:7197_t:CDS:2 [Dentiscutata heterogama]|uniref:7197_t:CDS:1 n=1 Tax=Dentiscutata heterogama TaxID=1316150 RepID=A0ACA9JWS3_9GLOM|nr:7197_t:CDS:2 [Dentiscutata heterogama]